MITPAHRIFGVLTLPALALLCLSGSPAARADDIYNNTFRLGGYFVFYNLTSADDLQGPYVPADVSVKFNNVQTLYFAYVRRFGPHFDLEFAIGYPPKTETVGVGPAKLGSVPYAGEVISTAKWIAPTLLFNYKFRDESDRWRPYIGVGVNYTNFVDRQSTAAGNAATGGPTAIELSPSWGPAATVGMSYAIAPRWSLYASYSYSVVRTRLEANTAGLIRTTHVSFNPTALVVAVGFHF